MKNKYSILLLYFCSICLILVLCLFGSSSSSFVAAAAVPTPTSENANTPEQTMPSVTPDGAQGNQVPGRDRGFGGGFPGGGAERGMGFPPGGGGEGFPSFNQQNTQQGSMTDFISSVVSILFLLLASAFVHLYKRKRL